MNYNANGQNKPSDDDLANRFIKMYPNTAFGLGSFRRYTYGYWPEISETQVKKEVMNVLEQAKSEGIRPTRNLFSSVLELIKIKISVEDGIWDDNPDALVLTNGTLELSSRILREHSKKDYLTSALSFAYDPTADAPALKQALSRLAEEVVGFIQEYYGYALTLDTSHEIALWFFGGPGCGKSTLVAALEAVAGSRCLNLSLANLERSQFALSNISGKTVALSTEQPAGYMSVSPLLNAMISGERVTVDIKYRHPFDVTSRLKFVWFMNDKPRLSGEDGLFRRIMIVEFPPLRSEERTPHLKEAIRQEGPGILN